MLGAMSFLFYFAVMAAALVSVIMGVDLAATPPPSKPAIQAIGAEPIRHAPTLPPVAVQEPAAPATVPPDPPRQTVSQSSEPDAVAAPEPVAPSSAPACNVPACEAAYRSFTPADCTYQPFDGPRRLCTK